MINFFFNVFQKMLRAELGLPNYIGLQVGSIEMSELVKVDIRKND